MLSAISDVPYTRLVPFKYGQVLMSLVHNKFINIIKTENLGKIIRIMHSAISIVVLGVPCSDGTKDACWMPEG